MWIPCNTHEHYGSLLMSYARAQPDVRSAEFPLTGVVVVFRKIVNDIIEFLLSALSVRSLREYQTFFLFHIPSFTR